MRFRLSFSVPRVPSGCPVPSALLLTLLVVAGACSSDAAGPTDSTTTPSPTSSSSTSTATDTPTSSVPDDDSADPADPPVTGEPGGFDDHAARTVRSIDDFDALAAEGSSGQAVLKFLIPDLLGSDPELAGDVYWLDSNFFKLHDEWVFFRLLNNQEVPGVASQPLNEGSFTSIEEIYEHFDGVEHADLPGDLRWTPTDRPGERLYVGEFYAQALRYDNDNDDYDNYTARTYGMGSIIRTVPTDLSDARWLMELQFSERVTPEEMSLYFDSVLATLPEQIGSSLEWIIRSAEQEDTAAEMEANDFAYADRVVRWSEIVPPGAVEVYNEGIAAGRLLLVEDGGKQLSDARDTDIVLIERVPDFLPPANALITSDPQTPLAHVNLLARNRGIPNASRSGLLDDLSIRRHAVARAPAIVRTNSAGELEIQVIRTEDYRAWLNLLTQEPIEAPPIPAGATDPLLALTDLAQTIEQQSDIDALLPVIGGKAAGFLSLLGAEGVTTPPDPVVITTQVYEEHLDQVRPALEAMLALDDFDAASNTRLRVLMLQGRGAFDEAYPEQPDQDFADGYFDEYEADQPGAASDRVLLEGVVEAGGFAKYLRDASIAPDTLEVITAELEANFGEYAPAQGLRFRSSSSVEDIEGFSGAGLYDSSTGFLDAAAQSGDDQKKTIERTLKKTWGSYWGFEAYEERRREQVDHTSGAMGVVVHARFDDDLELANGVATFRINPTSGTDPDVSVATINVQKGAVSVTNPDPDVIELPEVVEVRTHPAGDRTSTQLASSTLSPDTAILSDAELLDLHDQIESVANLWMERVNESLPEEQRISTLTLDYEFKVMAPGWPQLTSAAEQPRRIVVKQARSLDPGLRGFDRSVIDLPVPRDVLARARLIEEVTCAAGTHVDVFTTPNLIPDIGYDTEPFSTAGSSTADSLEAPAHAADEREAGCTVDVLFSSPDEFLVALLDQPNN